jgi:hypothetical protein
VAELGWRVGRRRQRDKVDHDADGSGLYR